MAFFDLTANDDNVTLSSGLPSPSGGAPYAIGDSVRAFEGNDIVNGSEANDDANGNVGNDTVSGVGGDDNLRGGQGDDVLLGQDGNDVLSGDRGRDFLTGGFGADTFVLTNNADNVAANGVGADVITDFTIAQADKIQLVGAGFADITFETIDLIVDGGTAVASTAIKLKTGGQYLGVVQGVSPFDMANPSLFI